MCIYASMHQGSHNQMIRFGKMCVYGVWFQLSPPRIIYDQIMLTVRLYLLVSTSRSPFSLSRRKFCRLTDRPTATFAYVFSSLIHPPPHIGGGKWICFRGFSTCWVPVWNRWWLRGSADTPFWKYVRVTLRNARSVGILVGRGKRILRGIGATLRGGGDTYVCFRAFLSLPLFFGDLQIFHHILYINYIT